MPPFCVFGEEYDKNRFQKQEQPSSRLIGHGNRGLFYRGRHRGWNGDKKGDEKVISVHRYIKPFPSNLEAVFFSAFFVSCTGEIKRKKHGSTSKRRNAVIQSLIE